MHEKVTLHQGAIERIFLDSLAESGVRIDRPVHPIALELSEKEDELKDPSSYPIKVVPPSNRSPLKADALLEIRSL